MNSAKPRLTIREQLAEHAYSPCLAYDGYVWMVHTRDHPVDSAELQERKDVERLLAAKRANDWATASPTHVRKTLCGQLNLVLKRSLVATDITPDYTEALNSGKDTVMKLYLTDVVGQLVMSRVADDPWLSQNPEITNLRNPFENTDILAFFWRLQNRAGTARLGGVKLPPDELIIPGYRFLSAST